MSGRKINDHSFWAGSGSEGSVFPMGAKTKKMAPGEGCGDLKKYQDSAESIKQFQDFSDRKAESNPMRDGYRY